MRPVVKFWPIEMYDNTFMLFEVTRFMVICCRNCIQLIQNLTEVQSTLEYKYSFLVTRLLAYSGYWENCIFHHFSAWGPHCFVLYLVAVSWDPLWVSKDCFHFLPSVPRTPSSNPGNVGSNCPHFKSLLFPALSLWCIHLLASFTFSMNVILFSPSV